MRRTARFGVGTMVAFGDVFVLMCCRFYHKVRKGLALYGRPGPELDIKLTELDSPLDQHAFQIGLLNGFGEIIVHA